MVQFNQLHISHILVKRIICVDFTNSQYKYMGHPFSLTALSILVSLVEVATSPQCGTP
jgi:hypothetical protein